MYPKRVMQSLRQRLFDIEKDDTSRDDEIMALPKIRAFQEYLDWTLGNGWGETITEGVKMFGLIIVEGGIEGVRDAK
jgi:hypothetical protein